MMPCIQIQMWLGVEKWVKVKIWLKIYNNNDVNDQNKSGKGKGKEKNIVLKAIWYNGFKIAKENNIQITKDVRWKN